jgi:hypothetical protein
MLRFHRGKIQRIPVLWIPSTNRTIPVASVARREIYTVFDRHNSDYSPVNELDRLFSLDGGILLKEE